MIESPNIVDLAEAIGEVDPLVWSFLQVQLDHSESYGLRDEAGRALFVGGYFPVSADCGEAWFVVAPAAARRMLAIVRIIRLTASRSRYRRIITRTGTAEGERIARLGGFRPLIGDIWRFDHAESDRRGTGLRGADGGT